MPQSAGGQTAPPCETVVPDGDGDGLADSCERHLADRFAPEFRASVKACNWDPARQRLAGGYLHAVEPVGDTVRLVYMPAYFDDCGWQGPKCWLRWRGGCDPHTADSELVIVDVVPRSDSAADAARGDGYVAARVFLSAHCFSSSDGRCRWYQPRELEWADQSPIVWVAEGKNANYPSRNACDSGHWSYDTCDRNEGGFRFPVEFGARNVGSESNPLPDHGHGRGCVSAEALGMDAPSAGAVECVWTSERFHGWHDRADQEGATGYRRYLKDFAKLVG